MSEALAALPLPVVIVAAAAGGERSCSTGTLTYVSYDPPRVAIPLRSTSRTLALARAAGTLSVSLLAADQADLAVRAARSSTGDKFAEHQIPALEGAVPAVAGASAVLWCEIEAELEAGTTVLCVARVYEQLQGPGEPLVRHRHVYRALGAGVAAADEAPYPL